MDTSRRASGYDVFKLIVAVILLFLFLFLLRREPPQALAPASTVLPTLEVVPSSSTATTVVSTSHTPTVQPIKSPSATRASGITDAPLSPSTSTIHPQVESTTTQLPSDTATIEPTPTDSNLSPTVTEIETPTVSVLPNPTGTAVITSTPVPIANTQAPITTCEAATVRSRLKTGRNAILLHRLNFRSSPGIQNNWLRTNLPGTPVEVIGGPECLPHLEGAYVWWQIRLPDGEIGWSAEGSIHGTFYFMEPLE